MVLVLFADTLGWRRRAWTSPTPWLAGLANLPASFVHWGDYHEHGRKQVVDVALAGLLAAHAARRDGVEQRRRVRRRCARPRGRRRRRRGRRRLSPCRRRRRDDLYRSRCRRAIAAADGVAEERQLLFVLPTVTSSCSTCRTSSHGVACASSSASAVAGPFLGHRQRDATCAARLASTAPATHRPPLMLEPKAGARARSYDAVRARIHSASSSACASASRCRVGVVVRRRRRRLHRSGHHRTAQCMGSWWQTCC